MKERALAPITENYPSVSSFPPSSPPWDSSRKGHCKRKMYWRRSVSCLIIKLISKALRTARVKGITQVLPATHMFIYKWNMQILPSLPSRRASPHFGRYAFPIPQRVGGWVGLGGWLYTIPKMVTITVPTGQTLRQPGIKLTTIESQDGRPKH